MSDREPLIIGQVVAVHGTQGALKVRSFAESAETFSAAERVMLRMAGGPVQTFEVQEARPQGRGLVLRLHGVSRRSRAEELVGADILIAGSSLPPLEEGTYYWVDLIGAAVYEGDTYIGRLTSILPTGSNDVYVVQQGDKEILIPALASVIREVDVESRKITVALPEGL